MSRKLLVLSLLLAAACSDQTDVTEPAQTAPAAPAPAPSDVELEFSSRGLEAARTALSGGATTVFDATADAFSLPSPNLAGRSLAMHDVGDVQFEVEFVSAPGAPSAGLGPVFDNVSCEACHVGDGRGRPPEGAEPFASLLFRGSVRGFGPHGGPNPIPGFGGQIQLHSIPGVTPEASASITYADSAGTFADGSPYTLRVPRYTLTGGYRALPGGVLFSPRVAPVVFGLGLLEAVPDRLLRSLADPRDRNRDGVSGRTNIVWDAIRNRPAIGRFGWKANVSNLLQQAAGAYNGDMGITSAFFPAESCEGQYPGCAPHAPEIDAQLVRAVAFYTQTLGVPARRSLDDQKARKGERLFYAANCNSCHVQTLRTGFLKNVPEVSNQTIHPYTDLLLHDMGPALADGRPDFLASGSEWRTPPLWGIGLVQTVNGHAELPARRPGPRVARGGALARRRGQARARDGEADVRGGAERTGGVPRVALKLGVIFAFSPCRRGSPSATPARRGSPVPRRAWGAPARSERAGAPPTGTRSNRPATNEPCCPVVRARIAAMSMAPAA